MTNLSLGRRLKLFRFVVTCGRVKLFGPNHVRELP